jgi:hypothetical protein
MNFKITAVRNGAPVLFNVDGSTKEEAFARWKASAMSAGCTRATADYEAANVPGLETRSSRKAKLAVGAITSDRCETCGMTTLFNSWDRSASRVHKVGCASALPGDFVTTIPLGN